MSKKNNKSKKKQFYNYDLEREKKEQEAKKQKAEKSQAVSGGVKKVKKTKAVRLRKGVKVRGIKIVDSSSKKKAQRLLQAEQARKALAKMDVEDGPAATSGSKTKVAAGSKTAGKRKAAAAGGTKKREPKAAGPKPMAVE